MMASRLCACLKYYIGSQRSTIGFDPLLPVELKASGPSRSSLYDPKQTLAPRPQEMKDALWYWFLPDWVFILAVTEKF
jgi:hypothetical protein